MDSQVLRRVANEPAIRDLFVRQIHLRFADSLQSPHPDIMHHPNHLAIMLAKNKVPP